MNSAPYEAVKERYTLPFPADQLHEKQAAIVNDLAPLARTGYYCKVGTGKTAMSAVAALFQQLVGMADCHFVLVPPILVTQWVKWLRKIQPVVRVVDYRGEPKQRRAIDLTGANFVVMSLGVFKRDFEYLQQRFADVNVAGILDEATAIKNIESANYRKVREFFTGRSLLLLTGTPCATPLDSYAYIKLIAPDCYRNKQVFDSVHIGEKDFFDKIVSWNNLDLLKRNMEINTRRLEKREIFGDLPVPIYDPIEYDLAPNHYALYEKLCEEQVLELESGGKIDATTVSKLWTCCQQIVMNWAHFSEDPGNISAGFELVDEVLDELGAEGKKLIIVANYKMTMAALFKYLKERRGLDPVLINSTVTPGEQERGKDRFVDEASCGPMLLHPLSGGKGWDGLQHVCSEMLFVEEPLSPIDFEQPVGRIDRPGQTESPHIRLAVARKTIQVRLHNLLLKKDELATYVQGGWRSLREALYGGT